MKSTTHRHVIISDEEYELPYSKGLIALSQVIELVVAQATDAVPSQTIQRSIDGVAMSAASKGATHMPGGEV